MLSVKSQHNTVLSQHNNIVYLYFPQNHTRFLDIKMKYDSYERMTML